MKKVVVVTVNFNTEEDTTTFLHSLKKVKTPDFSLDIIIVDNGSKNVFKLPDDLKNRFESGQLTHEDKKRSIEAETSNSERGRGV